MRKGPAGALAAVVLILLTLLNTYFILKAKDENAQRITETHINCRNITTLARKAHVSIRNCKGERLLAVPTKRRANNPATHGTVGAPPGASSAAPGASPPVARSPIARANPLPRHRIVTRTVTSIAPVPTASGPSPAASTSPAAPSAASRPASASPETQGPFGLPCLMPGGIDVLC